MVVNNQHLQDVSILQRLARNCNHSKKNEAILKDFLHKSVVIDKLSEREINLTDNNGRTIFSYIVTNCSLDLIEMLLKHFSNIDVNKADNEGNSPLHFIAQAGQIDHLNYILTREAAVDIDSRNHQGFTPLMKAAIQGRTKCAKLLLLFGANPMLTDNCRNFRAEQWARFCGRQSCAEVIGKITRNFFQNRLRKPDFVRDQSHPLRRVLPANQGIKSKLRRVFCSVTSNNNNNQKNGNDNNTFGKFIAHFTTVTATCATSPILAVAKSQTIPALNICLINNSEC